MSFERREKILGFLLLVLVSILYFFANLQKVVVPGSVFNELQQIFNCDAGSVTGLGAGFMYVYSLNQLTVGVLADRYSGTRVIMVGGALFCIGSLLSAYSGSLAVLMFSRILTGFGASVIYLSMLKLIFRITPENFTVVLGIIMIVGYSGSIVSGAPFVKFVNAFGYSKCMLTVGIVTVVCYALFLINVLCSKLPPVDQCVKLNLTSFKNVLKQKHNIHLYMTTGIGFAVFYSMQMTIGKKYMEDFSGLSSDKAGLLMSVTMVISSCNAFLLALLSKLAGNRRRPFMYFCGFGTLAGSLMLLSAVLFDIRAWQLSAAAWILFSFAGNCSTIQVAIQKETNPANRVGTSLSIGNCFSYLIIAIVGTLTGKLLEIFPPQIIDGIKIYGRNSYLAVFILLTVLGGMTAVNALFLKETRGKNIEVD